VRCLAGAARRLWTAALHDDHRPAAHSADLFGQHVEGGLLAGVRSGQRLDLCVSAYAFSGELGITTQHDVTLAWHKSTHTDPGPAFPMGAFITAVNGHAPQAPTTKEWDEMATKDEIKQAVQEVVDAAVAKLHADHLVLLHGTVNGTHPNNLDNIGKAVGVPQ
jgi:hypothetical protein